MNRRKKTIGFFGILFAGGAGGVLLLARALIYLVLARGRSDANAYAAVDFSAVVFIFHTLLCCWFCLRHCLKRSEYAEIRQVVAGTPLKWLVLYMAICLCSALWSSYPVLSGYRAVECLSLFGVILICFLRLCREGGIPLLIAWILRYIVVTALMKAITRIQEGDLRFVCMASQMDATVFFFLALLHERSAWVRWIVYAFAILSYSTTAYIGMVLGTIGLLFHRRKGRWIFALCAIACVTGILFVGGERFLASTVFSQRSRISWQATSGRDRMWRIAWEAFPEHPLLGSGFFTGEIAAMRNAGIGAAITNAHNSFSSAALGSGLLGMVPLCIFFLQLFFLFFGRRMPSRYRGALLGCFCVAFLHCMGNPGVGSRVFGGWISETMLFVLISLASFSSEEFSARRNGGLLRMTCGESDRSCGHDAV